jgi:hypothetical protein
MKNKQQAQIKKDGKSFIVKDDIEYGYQNVIPLWAFGFNYKFLATKNGSQSLTSHIYS